MIKIDDLWIGLHKELGVVIYDQKQIVKNGKYQFKLWSHQSNRFIGLDRGQARAAMLKTPIDKTFLRELTSIVSQYQGREGHGSLRWTDVAGPSDPVLARYDSHTGDPVYVDRLDAEKEEYDESEIYNWGESVVDRNLEECDNRDW